MVINLLLLLAKQVLLLIKKSNDYSPLKVGKNMYGDIRGVKL